MSGGGYIRIYLAVQGPETKGGFGLEEKSQKTKAVCDLGRTNYGGLRNVRPPIIDPLSSLSHKGCVCQCATTNASRIYFDALNFRRIIHAGRLKLPSK